MKEQEINKSAKTDKDITEDENTKQNQENYMALGMCFGVSIGGLIGYIVFSNFSLGMCFGLSLGMAIGITIKKK